MKVITKSLRETSAAAALLVDKLVTPSRGGAPHATILALSGDLGSGKTAFTQGVASALGVQESVVSPTFVLQKIYQLNPQIQQTFSHLIHIDAYRMEREQELAHIGWSEIIKDPQNLICIEWPEVVQGQIPPHAIVVKCGFLDEQTHEYEVMWNSHE